MACYLECQVFLLYIMEEWGIEGKNRDVMKRFVLVLKNRNGNELSDAIAAYAKAHHTHPALYNGGYANLL